MEKMNSLNLLVNYSMESACDNKWLMSHVEGTLLIGAVFDGPDDLSTLTARIDRDGKIWAVFVNSSIDLQDGKEFPEIWTSQTIKELFGDIRTYEAYTEKTDEVRRLMEDEKIKEAVEAWICWEV